MTPIYLTLLALLKKVPGARKITISFSRWIVDRRETKALSHVSPAVYVIVEARLRAGKLEAANDLARDLIWSVRTSNPNRLMRDFGINLNVHQLSAIYGRHNVQLPEQLLNLFEELLNSYGIEYPGTIDERSHAELRSLSETLREEYLAPKFSKS